MSDDTGIRIRTITFELRQAHLDLLEQTNVRWSNVEYGAPGIDEKRPFGNSGSACIEREICDYLGYEPVTEDRYGNPVYDEEERSDAVETYGELDSALQIVLSCQTFTPGVFEKQEYTRNWRRVAVAHGDDCPSCGNEVSLAIQIAYGEYTCPECGMVFDIETDSES